MSFKTFCNPFHNKTFTMCSSISQHHDHCQKFSHFTEISHGPSHLLRFFKQTIQSYVGQGQEDCPKIFKSSPSLKEFDILLTKSKYIFRHNSTRL